MNIAHTEILYIESSLPSDITLADYRRARPRRRTRWQRLTGAAATSSSSRRS